MIDAPYTGAGVRLDDVFGGDYFGATAPMRAPAPDPDVVALAMAELGVPYVYGGADPSGFDDAGLTMYVYAQLGVTLPHSVAGQFDAATRIPRRALYPGDLVFAGASNSDLRLVGVYAGNGIMIDAEATGQLVRFDPLPDDYVGAVRPRVDN